MSRSIKIEFPSSANFTTVREAVMLANQVLANEEFYSLIALHEAFDLSDTRPATIARMMRAANFTMSLHFYYSISPVRNIDGYDDLVDPCTIHLNLWKIDRSPESICNTIIHACVHAVNAANPSYSFGHGDDTLNGKSNTAPYSIGALAQTLVSQDDPIIIPMEHDMFEPRLSGIKKPFAGQQFMMAT